MNQQFPGNCVTESKLCHWTPFQLTPDDFTGACVPLEQKMQTDLLLLACSHHVLYIILEAAVMHSIDVYVSKSPVIAAFKRFQAQWAMVNQMAFHTATTDELTD